MKAMKTVMLLGVLAFAPLTHAASGIAFIHGTGSQTDALNDYWTPDFVDSVTEGQPSDSKYTVINCDFNQFMWADKASGCLAGQLTRFINNESIDSLTLVTHSNGGNVVRWILSNPTWDARYPKLIKTIKNVIALAPSSGGTPLADVVAEGNVFERDIGWLLGYASDAVKQQQVSWMSYFNNTWLNGTAGRPPLPVKFETVVGSNVDSKVWDSSSYCGGYPDQVALAITQNWLDSCSDGFLDCSSQSAAGSVWFTDKDKTRDGKPLSHNQSRRNCFDLGHLLRDHLLRDRLQEPPHEDD